MPTLADLPTNVAAEFAALVDGVWGGRVDTGWTQACAGGNCAGSAHIYCFEQ